MPHLENKKNFMLKSKRAAKRGALLSFGVFVFSFLAGFFVTNGTAVNALGNISVFSVLFFTLSLACLFLLQLEAWEKDWV